VGLGYFGDHSLAIAERLAGWVPEVLGVDEGLLFECGPRPGEPSREPHSTTVETLARYVDARARALPLATDPSAGLAYRGAAWHRSGKALACLYGRLEDIAAPLVSAAAKEILRVDRPSVIDGQA